VSTDSTIFIASVIAKSDNTDVTSAGIVTVGNDFDVLLSDNTYCGDFEVYYRVGLSDETLLPVGP